MKHRIYAVLSISTFAEISPGAIHYYGMIRCNGKQVDISRVLSKKEADQLNKEKKDKRWKSGDTTFCFNNENQIKKIAKKHYKEWFPNAEFLLVGSYAYLDPQYCLDGQPKIKAKINRFYRISQKIGGYEVDEKAMTENSDQYMREILGFDINAQLKRSKKNKMENEDKYVKCPVCKEVVLDFENFETSYCEHVLLSGTSLLSYEFDYIARGMKKIANKMIAESKNGEKSLEELVEEYKDNNKNLEMASITTSGMACGPVSSTNYVLFKVK